MTRVAIGGVFRCCLDVEFPSDASLGTTIPCRHCRDGGMRYVMQDDGEPAWEAAWITLGHDWRRQQQEVPE